MESWEVVGLFCKEGGNGLGLYGCCWCCDCCDCGSLGSCDALLEDGRVGDCVLDGVVVGGGVASRDDFVTVDGGVGEFFVATELDLPNPDVVVVVVGVLGAPQPGGGLVTPEVLGGVVFAVVVVVLVGALVAGFPGRGFMTPGVDVVVVVVVAVLVVAVVTGLVLNVKVFLGAAAVVVPLAPAVAAGLDVPCGCFLGATYVLS